jgi:dipeptidyl aminopeptidase/acylaminoacyl peptidase
MGRFTWSPRVADLERASCTKGTDPHSISWSPDGKRLAFVEGGNRLWQGATGISNTAPSSILVVPAAGGRVDTIMPATQ